MSRSHREIPRRARAVAPYRASSAERRASAPWSAREEESGVRRRRVATSHWRISLAHVLGARFRHEEVARPVPVVRSAEDGRTISRVDVLAELADDTEKRAAPDRMLTHVVVGA